MKPAVIFLDDGGVLNDNAIRSAEWRRLTGEYLSPRLGGDRAAWGQANSVVFDAQWQRFEAWQEDASLHSQVEFFTTRAERIRWLTEMCDHVGVPAPQGDACLSLAIKTEEYVMPRIRAAFPEAVDAIRELHARRLALATASGALSNELGWRLDGMGVREYFTGRLYGPDLIGTPKSSPEYYKRIFADTQLDPGAALVVDDNVRAVGWAAEAGARTVHVCRRGEPAPAADHVVVNLFELVALVESV